jgi:tetratricopeptide (TPR) repeat protein
LKLSLSALLCLFFLAGCAASVPRQTSAPAPPPISTSESDQGPAKVAVLAFENRTGDPELNWLRTTISATMAARFRSRMGWSTADGSFVREMMALENMGASATLESETAIGLSGVLYAESIVTGGFEGKEEDLTITAAHYSGETGQLIRTTTRTVQYNNRSALINQLVGDIARATEPDPVTLSVTDNGDAGVTTPLGPIGRSRSRTRIDRPAIRLPSLFQMETPEQIEQTIRLYRRALELNPNYADAHFTLGYAFDKQGDIEKALASYRQAVTLEPLNADYLYLLGYTYERNKDMPSAVDAYDKALITKPDDADIAFSLGYASEKTGQYTEAIEAYTRAIELKPDDYDSYYGLASVYESSGRLREALASFQEVVSLKPDEEGPLRTLGAIALKLEKWDEVSRVYELLADRNPEDVDPHRILAIAYKRQGLPSKAIGAYTEIVRLEPSSSDAYASLGNLHVGMKMYDEAVVHYRAGLAADPKSDLIYYNLGNVLSAQKEYRAAIDAYVGYLRISPGGKYVQKVRDKVEDLRFRVLSSE